MKRSPNPHTKSTVQYNGLFQALFYRFYFFEIRISEKDRFLNFDRWFYGFPKNCEMRSHRFFHLSTRSAVVFCYTSGKELKQRQRTLRSSYSLDDWSFERFIIRCPQKSNDFCLRSYNQPRRSRASLWNPLCFVPPLGFSDRLTALANGASVPC